MWILLFRWKLFVNLVAFQNRKIDFNPTTFERGKRLLLLGFEIDSVLS